MKRVNSTCAIDISSTRRVLFCHRHYTYTTAGGYIAPIHLNGMGVMPMNDMNVFLLLLIVLVILLQKK